MILVSIFFYVSDEECLKAWWNSPMNPQSPTLLSAARNVTQAKIAK